MDVARSPGHPQGVGIQGAPVVFLDGGVAGRIDGRHIRGVAGRPGSVLTGVPDGDGPHGRVGVDHVARCEGVPIPVAGVAEEQGLAVGATQGGVLEPDSVLAEPPGRKRRAIPGVEAERIQAVDGAAIRIVITRGERPSGRRRAEQHHGRAEAGGHSEAQNRARPGPSHAILPAAQANTSRVAAGVTEGSWSVLQDESAHIQPEFGLGHKGDN